MSNNKSFLPTDLSKSSYIFKIVFEINNIHHTYSYYCICNNRNILNIIKNNKYFHAFSAFGVNIFKSSMYIFKKNHDIVFLKTAHTFKLSYKTNFIQLY